MSEQSSSEAKRMSGTSSKAFKKTKISRFISRFSVGEFFKIRLSLLLPYSATSTKLNSNGVSHISRSSMLKLCHKDLDKADFHIPTCFPSNALKQFDVSQNSKKS